MFVPRGTSYHLQSKYLHGMPKVYVVSCGLVANTDPWLVFNNILVKGKCIEIQTWVLFNLVKYGTNYFILNEI